MTRDNVAPSRMQYTEQLVDACLQDYTKMQRGLMVWAEEQVATWKINGSDEDWRRLRIESARSSYKLCQTLAAQGATPAQMRRELRIMYEEMTAPGFDLYQMMLDRTGQTEPPHHGTTDDIMQRQALRVMVASAELAFKQAYCAWAESDEMPDTQKSQLIYDLSGVEELGLHLGMLHYQQECFERRPRLSSEEIAAAFYNGGKALREEFYRKYGFFPEESTTPFVPVTAEGPVDHDEYYAALRAAAREEEADE